MSMQDVLLRFDPLDSLFFRDGRPYTQGESEQVGGEPVSARARYAGRCIASRRRAKSGLGRKR